MIRLRDIHKEYQNGTKALKGVSMQIDDGDFVFLVGPSGSGKSTIIKLITAEISPTRGKLMVNGYNLNDISEKQIPLMRRTIGVVFQDFRLIEKKTVYENIEVAMRAVGATTYEIRRRIPYVLDLVGMISTLPFSSMSHWILLVFLAAGFVIGAGGSVMAIRKFLKV